MTNYELRNMKWVDPTDLNVLYSTNTGLKPGATKWVRASGSLI